MKSGGSEITGTWPSLNQPIREWDGRERLNGEVEQISVFLLFVITVKELVVNNI